MATNKVFSEQPQFARLTELVQRYELLKVSRQANGITFDVHELLPLEQVVFRRELLRVLEHLQEQTAPAQEPVQAWRITLLTADEPLIVDLTT